VHSVYAQQDGTPLNLMTTMANWAEQAQTALFSLAPPMDTSNPSSLQV
jgi:hypothetical protein